MRARRHPDRPEHAHHDGWELITIARSYLRFADIPIVLVTSAAEPGLACDEFNVGRLVKPYQPEELLAVVQACTAASG